MLCTLGCTKVLCEYRRWRSGCVHTCNALYFTRSTLDNVFSHMLSLLYHTRGVMFRATFVLYSKCYFNMSVVVNVRCFGSSVECTVSAKPHHWKRAATCQLPPVRATTFKCDCKDIGRFHSWRASEKAKKGSPEYLLPPLLERFLISLKTSYISYIRCQRFGPTFRLKKKTKNNTLVCQTLIRKKY